MGNWGKRIKITFADDGGGSEVFSVVSAELITKFRLKEEGYGTYIYPLSVSIGEYPNEIYLNFSDINNAQPPYKLEYLGGASLRGKDIPVESFELIPELRNLKRRGDFAYLSMSVDVQGEIEKAIFFDGKMYFDESLEMSACVAGLYKTNGFAEGYASGRLAVSNIGVTGTYADAAGVPV